MANPITRIANAGVVDFIVNTFGRKSASPTQTLGHSGAQVIGGYITTNEKNAKLIGIERFVTYSDMLANVSIVAAGMRLYLNLVANAGWTFDPPENDDLSEAENTLAKEYAEKVTDMSKNMDQPWHRIIRRAAGYRFWGFSLQEWTAKRRDDGLIGMLDVAARPQATIQQWIVDKIGTVQGVIQRSPQTQEELPIPRGKLVYMLDDSLNDTPEGMGLFRHLVEPSERLQYFQFLESVSYETNLRGIPIIRAPLDEMDDDDNLSAADKTRKLQPFIDLILKKSKGKEQGIIIGSEVYSDQGDALKPGSTPKWDISLLKGTEAGLLEVASSIERIQRELARIMGVEALLLGGDSKGTQALSKDKSLTFSLMVDSALTEIAQTFQRDWVRPIFILNGWDEKLMPTMKPDKQTRNIEAVIGAIEGLARAGAVLDPNDPIINWIRGIFGAPAQVKMEDREDGDEVNGDGAGKNLPGGREDPSTERDAQPDDAEGRKAA